MTTMSLSEHIGIKRRYSRSVNLERDLATPDALNGYIVTDRAAEFLVRIDEARIHPGSPRAWTLTGVYGTGKSAFAHFLAALHGPAGELGREHALEILRMSSAQGLVERFADVSSGPGFVRAVGTARREPVAHTVIRALARGTEAFWAGRRGKRPAAVEECIARGAALSLGEAPETNDLVSLVSDVARASREGLLLILDEFGKNLEQTVRSSGAEDLYLLQQLAELPNGPGDPPVLVLATLHQSFVEYGVGLTPGQRAEWDKVQGRFEHLAFAESPEDMLRLVADAIVKDLPGPVATRLSADATAWNEQLAAEAEGRYVAAVLTPERIESVAPLHPLAALVLPTLCAKYAQNDRSLFTFLSSHEPHSLARFLAERAAETETLPLLTIPELYDYFVESAGGAGSRPQFQRWTEVQGLLRDAAGVSPDQSAALKTIGTLNLVATGGPLRARRSMVLAALCNSPADRLELERWGGVLDSLESQRLVAYRRHVDEYRLWQGSDFDTDAVVATRIEADTRSLAAVLEDVAPQAPIVAQRHSYRTGTLRYFERRFADPGADLSEIRCLSPESDGVLIYWLGEAPPEQIPAYTADERPLAVLLGRGNHHLAALARETAALDALERSDPTLQTDGVARREVRQRLHLARAALSRDLASTFAGARFLEASGAIRANGVLGSALSDLCDQAYHRSPVLWTEMVNRRELTVQGAQSRRKVIEALLANSDKERLGIQGNGPEYSVYASVLLQSGIHRQEGDRWTLGPPTQAGLAELWSEIEGFCEKSVGQPRGIDQLYRTLETPPFGVKQGAIPLLLAAVLLYRSDDVSVYRDGTFLPLLGPEHFELLVKDPARFSVKHFAVSGLRLEAFKDLEQVLRSPTGRVSGRFRNSTLLGVVRPLVRFATALPAVTLKAADLNPSAAAVRGILLGETEPDRLLFEKLPAAVGLAPFGATIEDEQEERERLIQFRSSLFRTLRDLDGYYERLLDRCRELIHSAFGVRSELEHLREDLRVRSQYLVGRCVDPLLRRLTMAATATEGTDREWLESVVMIIADRPAEGWTERDNAKFELNLSDVANRFGRLESLLREVRTEGLEGYETRRVVITHPDGREVNRLVWLDRAQRGIVDTEARRIASELNELQNQNLRDAIVVALMEELVSAGEPVRGTVPGPELKTNHG